MLQHSALALVLRTGGMVPRPRPKCITLTFRRICLRSLTCKSKIAFILSVNIVDHRAAKQATGRHDGRTPHTLLRVGVGDTFRLQSTRQKLMPLEKEKLNACRQDRDVHTTVHRTSRSGVAMEALDRVRPATVCRTGVCPDLDDTRRGLTLPLPAPPVPLMVIS